MTKKEFMNRVAEEIAKKVPSDTMLFEREKDFSIFVKFAEGAAWGISLFNLYSVMLMYVNGGRSFPEAFNLTLKNIFSVLFGENQASDFIGAKDRIYPFVKPASFLNVPEVSFIKVAYTQLTADLIITYVIDSEESVTHIKDCHLQKWHINKNILHEIAMENFIKYKDAPPKEVLIGTSQQKMYIYNTRDSYDATRILLTHRMEEINEKLKNRALIGIPNRDFLIVFPNITSIRNRFAQMINQDAKDKAYGISNAIYSMYKGELIRLQA